MVSLTPQQELFFDTFGFLLLKRHIPKEELSSIDDNFQRAMQKTFPHDPGGKGSFDPQAMPAGADKRGIVVRYRDASRLNLNRLFMDEDTPELAALADGPWFTPVAEQLLPRGVICTQVVGHYRMGDTPWHVGNYYLRYTGVKFVAYLDPLNDSSGALRVIPDSHRNPLWQESRLSPNPEPDFGVPPTELPSHTIRSEPGDVIAFRHSLWHASFNGPDFRRMLEVNFYGDPHTPKIEQDFILQMKRNHQVAESLNRQFYPAFWRRPTSSRRIWWIERLRELGVLETPGLPPLDY